MHITREIIDATLTELDPVGLLALGAPADEYAPEVDWLWNSLKWSSSIASKTQITNVLMTCWAYWFGAHNHLSQEAAAEIATTILAKAST